MWDKLILAAFLAASAPEAYYQQIFRDRGVTSQEGEDFCWHARYYQDRFVRSYQTSHDTAWLDWGVKYYDFLVGKMKTGPDGYRGWIGPYEYDRSVSCDVHVGDAILLDGMLAFSEVVLKDPVLKAKYGEAANRYVAIAKRDVIEKWDRRGTWREDGPFGAYVERKEITGSGLSLPFNKQNEMALVALKLYRITGERAYRDKAEKIFSFMKSRFHYFDNHYVWNYWEPFGPWDVDPRKKSARHWVGVHPYRNYQTGEVRQIVEAYHSGIVFSRTDIERILNTNLEVMWNKDREHPKFVNSDDTYPEAGRSASHWSASNPYAKDGRAGALWPALADFSQTVRGLMKRDIPTGPPSFARKYAEEPVTLAAFPLGDSREINLAAALPSVFKGGEKTILISNSVAPGDIEVALYGRTKIAVLGHGRFLEWDGRGYKGEYRVRWTFGNGYREFPVTIR